ncbi:hypothetical protein TSAR_011900 [Trichomalopsis sarcophagae]|uniref:Uncharacterized protein n=1 Tax=Trichomalopsis sarcophagae TaxID=543379 RepID=A0A232EE60_9HYME|nr:hypothetical protein TSAR_011900 [Trichomalopsis sarcophagae]
MMIIIKELAAIDIKGTIIPRVYVFRPPCAWYQLTKKESLQRNYHGLDWDNGSEPFSDIPQVFKELRMLGGADVQVRFFVKGLEKKKLLEPYLDYVLNLEDINCPSQHTPGFRRPVVCVYHREGWKKNCALLNVMALRVWVNDVYEKHLKEGEDTVV